MSPIEVLILLGGLVFLAVVLGTAWQWWENQKLKRAGIPKNLESLGAELAAVRADVEKMRSA
jgi:hypothetical protein